MQYRCTKLQLHLGVLADQCYDRGMDIPEQTWHDLDGEYGLWSGRLPAELGFSTNRFEQLWATRPQHFHKVLMYGKLLDVPRWSEAYGRDYRFSGTVQKAMPVPPHLADLLAWSKEQIDGRLNGILVNWYDGALGHKIGPHRDVEKELLFGAPIVTISFGETRLFRMRPWKRQAKTDIEVTDSSVLVLPHETNLAFTHEVPASKRQSGRRISVTIRSFMD